MNITTDKIRILVQAIEEMVGQKVKTPKDFEVLSINIMARTGDRLSTSTLRRLWGAIDGDGTVRESTLDIIARFLNYRSYEDFDKRVTATPNSSDASQPLLTRHIDVTRDLRKGDRLRLTWLPGRVCDVVYNGSMHFTVVRAEQTRLQVGDTFLCNLIIEGEPLYLGLLQSENGQTSTYICGKKTGIMFERI